jgi:hypothetical protein
MERRIDVGDVTVVTDVAHEALGTALGEAADEPHDWYGLGRVDAGPLRLVLASNQEEFRRLSRDRLPVWGAGATFPDMHLVVLRLDAGDPYQTLRHELAHVVLHREVAVRMPLWFDEGYAVVAAHEYGRFAILRLNLAVATGHVPELDDVDAALRGSDVDAETAYALAGSAVVELGRQTHTGKLSDVLDLLREGMPFDSAVVHATGFTVEQFDEVWQRRVRHQYNWLVWIEAVGLWFLLSVVLAWASATRRRREAPRRAALDEGWPDPPPDNETITIQGVESSST